MNIVRIRITNVDALLVIGDDSVHIDYDGNRLVHINSYDVAESTIIECENRDDFGSMLQERFGDAEYSVESGTFALPTKSVDQRTKFSSTDFNDCDWMIENGDDAFLFVFYGEDRQIVQASMSETKAVLFRGFESDEALDRHIKDEMLYGKHSTIKGSSKHINHCDTCGKEVFFLLGINQDWVDCSECQKEWEEV